MSVSDDGAAYYGNLPVFHRFSQLTDPSLYQPVPDGWLIGISDIVQSTKAIASNRYKAVNMAGAAVIASVTNALEKREFPFVFGGDGASFAIPPCEAELARDALATTAAWVKDALDLSMRIAIVPIAAIRESGFDVRIARYAPSPYVSYAMFAGGGLAWADAAMKRGEFAVTPAPSGAVPDLSGLSCHFSEIAASQGLIFSILMVPASRDDMDAFRAVVDDVLAIVEKTPAGGRPVPMTGPPMKWPPPGIDYMARVNSNGPLLLRQLRVMGRSLISHLTFRYGIVRNGFVPGNYMRQLVENSDFRKYDDGLRMVIDCTPQVADAIEARLAAASSRGCLRYGLHRQDAALITCFTQSDRPDHFHFVDGARGGYASAASALKASLN
jgi:hypothetical protein